MKNLFLIQDSLTNKISYFHLILFVVSLPFDRFYSELILISFAIHTVIHFCKVNLIRFPWRDVLLLQGIFFLTLLATIYTDYPGQAWKEWEKQLAIFLFPLLLAITSLDVTKYRAGILSAFAASCTIVVTYLELETIKVIRYAALPISSLFSDAFINQNFTDPIGIHPTYLGIYVTLSIAIVLSFLFTKSTILHRATCGAIVLLLFLSLLQLGSKSVLFSLLLMLVLYPFFLANRRYNRRLLFLASTILVAIFFTLIQTTSLKKRFILEFIDDITKEASGATKNEYRIARWRAATDLIRHSPIVGFGTGSEIPLLKQKYFERKLYNSYLNELNAHNQYLGMMIKGGLVGVLLFLFTLFRGFSLTIKRRDTVMCTFFVTVALVSLSENILEVNKGIFYYSFFISLFVLAPAERWQRPETENEAPKQKKRFYEKKTLLTT